MYNPPSPRQASHSSHQRPDPNRSSRRSSARSGWSSRRPTTPAESPDDLIRRLQLQRDIADEEMLRQVWWGPLVANVKRRAESLEECRIIVHHPPGGAMRVQFLVGANGSATFYGSHVFEIEENWETNLRLAKSAGLENNFFVDINDNMSGYMSHVLGIRQRNQAAKEDDALEEEEEEERLDEVTEEEKRNGKARREAEQQMVDEFNALEATIPPERKEAEKQLLDPDCVVASGGNGIRKLLHQEKETIHACVLPIVRMLAGIFSKAGSLSDNAAACGLEIQEVETGKDPSGERTWGTEILQLDRTVKLRMFKAMSLLSIHAFYGRCGLNLSEDNTKTL